MDNIVKENLIPIYYIEDYMDKVICQAYENITKKKYEKGCIDICVFAADKNIFINWKINKYEPNAYKLAIKVRYRLKNNYNKYFDGTPIIFTKHTLESNAEIRDKLLNSKIVLITENLPFSTLENIVGTEVFEKIAGKIRVQLKDEL